jgi:hypothetical protein
MYASVATCPNITYSVSALSCFLDNPGTIHWEAAKHVFCYLTGTHDLTLTYREEQHELLGYTDANGASHKHHHAILGYTYLIDGGTISWQSRKQELVTLSTTKAEYSGLQKHCNVLQFRIVCSVALYGMEITLSIIERKYSTPS